MPQAETVEAIFANAAGLTDHEARATYLATACAGDERLRQQVEALLLSHADSQALGAGSFANAVTGDGIGEQAGDQVGAYRLVRPLGEGGFGVVFVAEQFKPLRRSVALKILKAGMDTRQVLLRFQQEQQTLALLDHPNIARVLDAGATPAGRPFFVMELIDGQAITAFCDEHRLSVPERLRLFAKVCRAVQHAHQKGIIHRDLKPSNILVTGSGEAPEPKIIDFGIAKALRGGLAEATVHTQWHQLLGTPAYMSPEQTLAGEREVDTRSDIYSLGVLLYELLTGQPPVQPGAGAGPDEWRQLIREEPVARPSAGLSRLSAENRDRTAALRNCPAWELPRQLRGDLDWIVLRATEKEPARRYESAEALARELERHLEHRPVEARPPSLAYLASRFIHRHRWWVAGGTAVLLALLAGGTAAGWGWWTAKREARIARAEKQKADEVLGLLFQSFVRVVPAEGGRPDYSVKQMLADLGQIADSGQITSPEVEAAVRDMLSFFHREFGELETARDHARKGLALIEGRGGDPRIAADLHVRLGQILKDIGPRTEALRHLEHALEIYRRTVGAGQPDAIRVMLLLARVRQQLGDGEAGVALAQEALEYARAQPGAPNGEAQLIRCLHMLAFILQHEGKFTEQESLVLERLELARRRNGEAHPETLHALADFGVLRFHQRRFDEASPMLAEALAGRRRILGDDYPDTLETMVALARCRSANADPVAATELFDEALRRSADTLDARNPYWREWAGYAAAHFEATGDKARADELHARMATAAPPPGE